MRNKLLSAGLAAFTVGCSTIPTGQIIEPAGPAPTNSQVEALVLPNLTRTLRDPDSLKQFAILGEPQLVNGTTAGQNIEQGWLICFEYNAKNGFGGYAGLTRDGYVVRLSGDEYTIISQINWIAKDRNCN